MSRQFSLQEGTYATGQTTQQQVLADVAALANFSNTQPPTRATAAAQNLCLGTYFDPCAYGPSDTGPFDIDCIRATATGLGYAANAGIFNQPPSYWTQFATWQDVLNDLQWFLNAANEPPGPNSVNQPKSSSVADMQAAYQVQLNAMYNVYGITLPSVQMSCPPVSPS
jgi:hypothetical protein